MSFSVSRNSTAGRQTLLVESDTKTERKKVLVQRGVMCCAVNLHYIAILRVCKGNDQSLVFVNMIKICARSVYHPSSLCVHGNDRALCIPID